MRNLILPSLFFLGFTALTAAAAADVDQSQVLGKLRVIDQTEIKVGQWAEEKGTTPEVKDYGRDLVKDHKKLDDQISKFAAKSNLNVADVQPSEDDKTAVDGLQAATGPEFDKKFLETMVKGHEDAINMVKAAKNESKDSKFKSFLASVVPKLEKHYKKAEKIEKKVTM